MYEGRIVSKLCTIVVLYGCTFVYRTHTLGIQNTFGCAAYLGHGAKVGYTLYLGNTIFIWLGFRGFDILGVHFSFKV